MFRISSITVPGILTGILLLLVPFVTVHADLALETWLEQAALPVKQSTEEAQAFLIRHLPELKIPSTQAEWETQASSLRQTLLQTIFLEHVPETWLNEDMNVVWGDRIFHEGYAIHKLRYEAVPGLWIPAILYEPDNITFPVPAILNVNGHDYENGKAAEAEQIRCINLARRGMLALHPEWFSCGELNREDYRHHNLAYLDVVGVRGVSVFYLAHKRALDVLLSNPHTGPSRVAMTGLSGGGCQTAFFSALDERIGVIVPVAGYGGMKPRLEDLHDLGDLEQVPSDFLTVADYAHITALFAPRPALLIYNRQDPCCFLPERALPATYDPALPVYRLFDAVSRFRFYINEVPGTHNYEQDNRLQFYHFLAEHFQSNSTYVEEISCAGELHEKEELYAGLPADNATFASLAAGLLEQVKLPSIPDTASPEFAVWQEECLGALNAVVRPRSMIWDTGSYQCLSEGPIKASYYELNTADWHLGLLYLNPPGTDAHAVKLIIADTGIRDLKPLIESALEAHDSLILFDPIFMGANRPHGRDSDKLAMVFESAGVRVLGLQAGQIRAVFEWARKSLDIQHITLCCVGWNASVAGLAACAGLDRRELASITLKQAPDSLKTLISGTTKYVDKPALFCYGLLRYFDMDRLKALCHPIPVIVSESDG